jgi:hypothetical protein
MNDELIDIYSYPKWIICGSKENFDFSINYNQIWGVNDNLYSQWKAIQKGDILFFYVTGIKKVIGVGQAGNKFIQREPLWPDEIEEGIIKYPLRFEFSLKYLIPENEWSEKGINITDFITKNLGKAAFIIYLEVELISFLIIIKVSYYFCMTNL